MYRENSLLERYAKLTREKKALVIVLYIVISFIVSVVFIGWFLHSIIRNQNIIQIGLGKGFLFTMILFSVLIIFGLLAIKQSQDFINTSAGMDERGVRYGSLGTKGTAHKATKMEVEEALNVSSIYDTDEFTYGQYTSDGQEVVSYKPKPKAPGTKDVLVEGTSGTSKSFSIVRPNILQAVERRHSMIVTDPSGELYMDLGQYLRNEGYDVKLLNLKDLDYSEFWDCLDETINHDTGRLDNGRLQEFVQIYMKNSASFEKQDFWYNCAVNLVEAVIGYLAVRRESKIIDGYIEVYKSISNGNGDVTFEKHVTNNFVDFPWCEKQILTLAQENGYDVEEIIELFETIKKNAPKYNMSELYDAIQNVTKLEEKLEKMPSYHPASSAFQRYKSNAKDAVRDGAIQGAQLKFKIFDNYKLRDVLSHKGVNFKTVNKVPSAYFVAISDTDENLNPIASLFFSFFIKDAQEYYDLEKQRAKYEGRKMQTIPVMAVFDEFASLGVITGSPTQFATFMNDSRKRDIYKVIFIQNHTQLEGIYGRFCKDSIISNCQTTLFLGGNDPETLEFISKKCGTTTVLTETHKEISGIFGSRVTDNEASVSSAERRLFTTDELSRMWDKVLVIPTGCSPFVLEPFTWIEHPAYLRGECEEVSYFDNIEKVSDKLGKLALEESEDPENEVRQAIMNFREKHRVNNITPSVVLDKTEPEKVETKSKKKVVKEIIDDKKSIVNEDAESLFDEVFENL